MKGGGGRRPRSRELLVGSDGLGARPPTPHEGSALSLPPNAPHNDRQCPESWPAFHAQRIMCPQPALKRVLVRCKGDKYPHIPTSPKEVPGARSTDRPCGPRESWSDPGHGIPPAGWLLPAPPSAEHLEGYGPMSSLPTAATQGAEFLGQVSRRGDTGLGVGRTSTVHWRPVHPGLGRRADRRRQAAGFSPTPHRLPFRLAPPT